MKDKALAFAIATLCLTSASPLLAAEAATADTPLLVYIDGKDSCRHLASGSDIARGYMGEWGAQFGASVKRSQQQTGRTPDYLIACLPLIGRPGTVDFYLVRSGSGVARYGRLAPDDFLNYVSALTAAASGPVHIAGHSYGGWLAMKAAERLPDGVAFATLLTIDPISVVNCQPLKGLADVIRTGAPERCNEAPADIGAAERSAVLQHTGRWLNYFETANAYLHSSAIPEADENIEVPFAPVGLLAGLRSENNPHLYIAEAKATWAEFLTVP